MGMTWRDPKKAGGSLGLGVLCVCVLREKVSCVALAEDVGLQLRPDAGGVPVLAENISRVGLAANKVESDDSGRNGLAATMVRKRVVLLVKTRVWHRPTCH